MRSVAEPLAAPGTCARIDDRRGESLAMASWPLVSSDRRTPSIRSTETTISNVERELVLLTSPSPQPSPGGRGRSSSVTWPCIFFVWVDCTSVTLRPYFLGSLNECLSVLRRSHRERVARSAGEGRDLLRGSLATSN